MDQQPRFRAPAPRAIWEADSPAAAALAARADGAAGSIAVEYRIGDGPWLPALVFAADVDLDAIRRADDAR